MAADMLLAVSMLLAPVGTPEQTPSPERWADVSKAIQAVAIEWEIMDKREERYFVADPNDFQADIDFLRRRRVEFADVPHVVDSLWLPTGEVVNEFIAV